MDRFCVVCLFRALYKQGVLSLITVITLSLRVELSIVATLTVSTSFRCRLTLMVNAVYHVSVVFATGTAISTGEK